MTLTTRRSVLAAVGVCLSTAGCVTDSAGTDTEESTTSERPTETTRSTEKTTTATTDGMTPDDDPKTTGDWIQQASNEPDPDLPIYLNNEAAEARTVRIWVVREETGDTVYEETHEVSAGAEISAYNLKRADPEGVEAFRVCGELVDSAEGTATTMSEMTASETTASETTPEESDTRGCETLRTNGCYGTVHVAVEEDGSLAVFYSIC